MRCPYCETDMTEGFLKSNQALYFSTDKEGGLDATSLSFNLNAGGFKDCFLYGSYLPAHYCPDCQILLAERPNRPSDLEQMKSSVKRTIKKLKKEDF